MTARPRGRPAGLGWPVGLFLYVLAAGCAPDTQPLGSDLGETIRREMCLHEAECFSDEVCTWAAFLDEDLCREHCTLDTSQARKCIRQARTERCPSSIWDLWPECLAAIECEEVALECIEWQFN